MRFELPPFVPLHFIPKNTFLSFFAQKLDFLLFCISFAADFCSRRKMSLNETITNATKPRGLSMEALIDPDANPVFGFWVNGVATILIGIVGIFGNCASIRVLSHKQMRSSVNYILIALASSDLVLIATAILLFGLTTVFPYNGMLKDYYYFIQPQIAKVVFPLATIGELLNVCKKSPATLNSMLLQKINPLCVLEKKMKTNWQRIEIDVNEKNSWKKMKQWRVPSWYRGKFKNSFEVNKFCGINDSQKQFFVRQLWIWVSLKFFISFQIKFP